MGSASARKGPGAVAERANGGSPAAGYLLMDVGPEVEVEGGSPA